MIGVAEAAPARLRSDGWQFLRDELTLTPERTSQMLRLTALVTLVVIVSMALRVPEAAVSAYMIFFVGKGDVTTTVRTGVLLVLALTVAIALAFIFYSFALANPAVRLPLMACLLFGGMYFLRTSPVGTLGLLFGFITSYTLTFADQEPSPEALARGLLWLWVVLAYPIALLVLLDLALGRRPDEVFRTGIAARLAAAADFLDAPAGSESSARLRLERQVRAGMADLAPYANQGSPSTAPVRAALLRQCELLGFLARDLPEELRRRPAAQSVMHRASLACLSAQRALLNQDAAPLEQLTLLSAERRQSGALPPATLAVVLPLISCIETVGLGVQKLLGADLSESARPARPPRPTASPGQQTEAVQFALKVTLATMVAYLIYSSLEWYSIHTALITCIFVAQDSLGATIHKLTLRIVGALIGAALGIGAIIVVLPQLESIGGLAMVVAAVTLLAAWLATGSSRISYAGWQIALAFYLTVLQGFSRTSHMYVGRDRVIGILLGNVLITVVFVALWPVRITPAMRQALSRAVASLAAMFRLAPDDHGGCDQVEATFYTDFSAARQYALLGRFESRGHDEASLMTAIQGLLIPIHAIVRDPVTTGSPAAGEALALLNDSVAGWLSAFSASIAAAGPIPAFHPPDAAIATLERIIDDAPETEAPLRLHAEWLGLLHNAIGQIAARAPT